MKIKFPLKVQVLFLFLITLAAYVNTFNHQYSLDDFLLTDNLPPLEEGWAGTTSVFTSAYNFFDYRPIAVFTYAIEQQLQGGLNPRTSHIVNVFFYFLCCLMLFVCLRRLPVPNAKWIAFIATAIFIVHPIHSNVVSSLKNRDAILSLTLGLVSIWLALKFISYEHEVKRKEITGKLLLLVAAIIVFLISTTAKLDAVSFIIILPLTFFIFSKNRMWLLYSGGLAYVIYAAFNFIRMKIITPRFLETTTTEESILVTENTMMLYDTISVKISTALITLFYYLKFHLVPKGYYYYFGYNMIPVEEMFIWQNILAAAVALISLIAFIYFFLKRPEVSFAIGVFYGGLAYCLNVYTPIAGIVAPRLAFIASVGFCLILALFLLWAAGRLHKKYFSKKWDLNTVSLGLLVVVLLVYLPFTINRNSNWKDLWTLIDADIDHLENSFEAQRIACMNYVDKSKWVTSDDEAIELLKKSLKHCTLASKVYDEDQFVEETIGLASFKTGDYPRSYQQFKKVLANFERTEIAHEYLGDMFMYNNVPDSASFYFLQLMTVAPDYEMSYIKYNQAMVRAGRVDDAIGINMEFVTGFPDYPFPYDGLGYLNLIKGDTLAATNYFFYAADRGSPNQQYIDATRPFFARNNLTGTLQEMYNGMRLPIE